MLTDKGRALLPIIDDMREYGEAWLCRADGEAAGAEPIQPDALALA